MRQKVFLWGLIILLCCLVGVTGYQLGNKFSYKRIVILDTKQLITNLNKIPQYQKLSQEDFELQSKIYLHKADKLIKSLAKEQNLLIVPKAAVIAGSPDITPQIIELLREEN